MQVNDLGIKIITSFEGCKLEAYLDSIANPPIWTIGYGCTHHVYQGLTITKEDAVIRLKQDIGEFSKQMTSLLGPKKINDDQFSALVSLLYNIGYKNVSTSTLLHCIRMNHINDASNEFEKWCKKDGVKVKGLLRRRLAEKSLFISDYDLVDKYINDPNSVDSLLV